MSGLKQTRSTASEGQLDAAEAALRIPSPRQRLDLGLGSVVAGLLALGGVAGYGLAAWSVASGWFDPPLLVEVNDPRILNDYRDNSASMVDLVTAGNDLLIGRQDGSVDVFDMTSRRFFAESLPRGGLLTGDLSLLATDCTPPACAEGGSSYALTAQGGLAQRRGGDWHVILGDMAFIGANGSPVEQADVRGWAASDDGALVLVDAQEQGLGLFDQRDGSWQRGPAPGRVTQGPLYYDNAFWIGSAQGLHRIVGHQGGTDWGGAPVSGTEGEILSMALSATDGLVVLRRGACAAEGTGCLSVLRIGAGTTTLALLAETEVNADLNDSGLTHVVRQGRDLLAIGSSGVHRYDAQARHWLLIDPKQPTAFFATANGVQFHIALPDRVISFTDGKISAESKLAAPLRQLLPGDGDALFGLDRDGQILALTPGTATVLAPADVGAPSGARFLAAVALGDLFVALGPDGVLVHDTKARRYSFTAAAALPPLALADAIVVEGDAGRVWMVSRARGDVIGLTISGAFPDKSVVAEAYSGPGLAVIQARAVPDGVDLIGKAGGVFHVTATPNTPVTALIGDPLAQNLQPVSMASAGDKTVFTDGSMLWVYDSTQRRWLDVGTAPAQRRLTDLALVTGGLAVMDSAGMAHWAGTSAWEPISGGQDLAAFGLSHTQDALSDGRSLLLASDDTAQTYHPDLRRFGSVWQMPGRQAELLGMAGDQPIWTNSGGVYSGETQLFGGPQFVDGWMGKSGPVAMGDAGGGRFYLAHSGGCLYRGVAAPVGEIRDVVPLDADRLLVRTGAGAGIYQPALHRWLPATGLGGGADSRLLKLGDHLVRLDPDGMASVPISNIEDISSCEIGKVNITWAKALTGRQASLVDGADAVLLLAADGALLRWQAGNITSIAPRPGEGPVMTEVLRAYPFGRGIDLLTSAALWHYDLPSRVWSHLPFQGAPDEITQIDLVRGADITALSIWNSSGWLWTATLRPGDKQITFTAVRRPVLPVIPIEPADIRDIVQLEHSVFVLSDRRLLGYQAVTETPNLDISLPASQSGWQLGADQGDGALILSDGAAKTPLSIHRIKPDAGIGKDLANAAAHYTPGSDRAFAFVRAKDAIELVRIDQDLITWRCALRMGDTPDCTQLAGPPMPLAAEDVLAFDTKSRILQTKTALWQLDAASRPLAQIAGPDVGAKGRLLRNGQALLFWEGEGRDLWLLADGKATRLMAAVDALRPSGSALAAAAGGVVIGIADGQLIPPQLPKAFANETVARSHFTAKGYGFLTGSGKAIAADGVTVSDPVLVFAPDTASVLLAPGAVTTAPPRWLRASTDGRLEWLYRDECQVPSVQPPSPAVGFIGPPLPPVPPHPEACVKTMPLPLLLDAGEQMMDLARTGAGALILMTSRRDVTLTLDETAVDETKPAAKAEPPALVRDATPNGGYGLVDGRSYLNPPGINGKTLHGQANSVRLNLLTAQPLVPFNLDWITWQRSDKTIRFAGSTAPVTLPITEALQDGRFLPMQEARGAQLVDGAVAWLTRFGLWQQRGDTLTSVALAPAQLPLALALDQGRFLWSGGGMAALDGAAATTMGLRNFTASDMNFTVDPFRQSVTASLTVAGQSLNAAASRGFLHDQRLSVAQGQMGAFYLTPVGLVPVQSLAGGIAAAPGTLRLEAEAGQTFARTASGWLQSAAPGAGWAATAAPFRNMRLAQENGRVWDRVDGRITLSAAESWRIARQGLNFDIDQLLGFAATPGTAVAVTRAGTHAATDVGGLRSISAPVAPAPSGGRLDSRRVRPGRYVLFTDAHQVWDIAAQQWRAPAADERPWQQRLAVQTAGITLAFGPGPQATIDVDIVAGGQVAQSFDWQAQSAMPFDHVTALHGDPRDADVLIGTRLGLRHLIRSGAGFANGKLFVTDRNTAAVTALGRPAATPDRIEARFADGSCVEMTAVDATPQTCTTAQGLDERFVARNAYWLWTKQSNRVSGRYLLDGGGTLDVPQPLLGYLPHDLLSDRQNCAGTTVEQWRNAEVVRIGNRQIAVPGLQSLYCLTTPALLNGGKQLQAGLYALTGSGVLQYNRGAFAALGTHDAAGLTERASGRVVLSTGRLRYGLEDTALRAQTLSLALIWQDTPWTAGRLALDQPRAIAWRGGLQSVTDAGVVDAPGGRLDSAALVVMATDVQGDLANCAPTLVETLDGRSHGLAALPGAPLRLYCRDGSWLQGVTDGTKDNAAFAPVAAVTSERTLVDVPGLWRIAKNVNPDGTPTALTFSFRDEPARLSAGRFDFDSFRALAAPFPDQTELLTDTGWWRAPAGTPLLEATLRPKLPLEPRQVLTLKRDLSPRDDTPGLCFDLGTGKSQFWSGGNGLQATGACRDFHGSDPIWLWWQQTDRPNAVGVGLNGNPLERQLVKGRFKDLVLNGPPLQTADGALLVPGGDGVLVLDPDTRQPTGIYAFADAGILGRSASGAPVWIGTQGSVLLEGSTSALPNTALACPALAEVVANLPEGRRLSRVQPGGAGWLSALIDSPTQRQQAMIVCADASQSLLWASRHDIRNHPRNLSKGASATADLVISLTKDAILLQDGVVEAAEPGGNTASLRGHVMRPDGSEVFLIDDSKLLSIALAPAISDLARDGKPRQTDTGTADPTPPPQVKPQPAPPATKSPAPPGSKAPTPAPSPQPQAQQAAPTAPTAQIPPSANTHADEAANDSAAVQRALAATLGEKITADGILGKRSRAAIARWQAQIGAAPTGYLGAAQVERLLAAGQP
ncbi:MAG: hypothetical protein CVT70_16905 [Alphaproteobacteria bacterium HGW-Alphaproteobacteria-1]|jgi:hypothetical protein|nr:MAG: hypothetical protein CVT70_16905 [Alphaproteobacteria bacterium HGW-Alphaproteobacteria-1]